MSSDPRPACLYSVVAWLAGAQVSAGNPVLWLPRGPPSPAAPEEITGPQSRSSSMLTSQWSH